LAVLSMTGYGRGAFESDDARVLVEITAVNGRGLEASVRLPRNMLALEPKVRATLRDRLNRGKVTTFVSVELERSSEDAVEVDEQLALGLIERLRGVSEKAGLPLVVNAGDLLSLPDVIRMSRREEDTEAVWRSVEPALVSAIDALVAMRAAEGRSLADDLKSRLTALSETITSVEKLAANGPEELKSKLAERIEELLEPGAVDPDRLAQEVAFYVDRSDVSEELTRLSSHVSQFVEAMDADEPSGRRLNFLVQEMQREANTLASKAATLSLNNTALNLKEVIEQVREQVQNIE
jgi:uncharacterized protein (TIGR00255 family)